MSLVGTTQDFHQNGFPGIRVSKLFSLCTPFLLENTRKSPVCLCVTNPPFY